MSEVTFSHVSAHIGFHSTALRGLDIIEPQREEIYLLTCALNEDSNQPAHPHSLIRVFVVHMKKLCNLSYPKQYTQIRF